MEVEMTRCSQPSPTQLIAGAVLAWLAVDLRAWGPQEPPYRADRPIAIVGGLLIDATGAVPRHDQTVVIRGDRIVEIGRSEEHTSELQSRVDIVCRLLLEKKKT